MTIKPPAKALCVTCPYRRDVPSGVWSADEYDKLAPYDRETWGQPTGVFMCHTQRDLICSGWAGTHDMENNLAVRLAAARGDIAPEHVDEVYDYTSTVPLFSSGAEAAAHGTNELETPGDAARRAIRRLNSTRGTE